MSDQPASRRRTWPVKVGCGVLVLALVVAITTTLAMPVIRGRKRSQSANQLGQAGVLFVYAYQFEKAPPRSTWSMIAEQVLGMNVERAVHATGPRTGWTESELALLRYFPEVDAIDLGPSELNGPLLETLRQRKNVRTLTFFSDQPTTRQSIGNLKHFPSLEHLAVSAVVLDENAWASIAGLRKLQSLNLVHCRATVPAPDWFRSPDCRIERASLEGDEDDHSVLKELRGWKSLQTLRMRHVTLDDSAVEAINSLAELKQLELYDSRIPADFSPAALTAKNLQSLALSRCEIQREANARCSSWQGRPKIELLGNTVID